MIQLLRRLGQIPEGHEDTIFKSISHEDFMIHAARLESWCHLPDTYSPLIDILRDVIELKKLNNSLMKTTLIDDLIADTYAMLYGTVVPELTAKATGEENRERMRVDNLLMNADTPADTPPPPASTPDPTAVKQRTKGVGRRELQRRAEAVIAKPSPANEVSRTPGMTETIISHHQQQQQQPQGISIIKEEQAREDLQGLGSSVPGSLHDSADDESELSEIEDEPVAFVPPIFPNLVTSAAAAETAGGDERMDGSSPRSIVLDSQGVDEGG